MAARRPLVRIGGRFQVLPAGDTVAGAPDSEAPIAAGTTAQYWRGDKTWQDFNASARATTLSGVVFTANSAIVAADSFIVAFGKLQTQINNRLLTTGTAAAATKLATARTINGVNFDGTANITVVDSSAVPLTQRGAANGVATLDASGTVPAAQLPSYVDDVLEYATYADLPATGESGKIYVLATPYTSGGVTSSQFRWSGSAYAAIIASPGSTDAVTEGSNNLYFTADRVRSVTLAGVVFTVNSAVVASDTLLAAIGKLQTQLNNKLGATANAASATKLATARSIALGGDASGSVNFDGSANVSITASVAVATKLRTARSIGGSLFDATADIGVNAQWIGETSDNMFTGTQNYGDSARMLFVEGIYQGLAKGYPIDFGHRMLIRGRGLAATELYHEWASGATRLFARARGDINTHSWTAAREVAFVDYVQNQIAAQLSRTGGQDSQMTGELQSTALNFFRAVYGTYGTIFRQDNSAMYILVTAKDDKYGSWTTQRPLILNLDTGVLSINGSAGSASKLVNARLINGVSFDGSKDITLTDDTKEPSIGAGTAAQYWRGDKTWQDLAAAVRAAVLTGLNTGISAAIAATDSVLGAMGKLQAQLTTAQSLLVMAPFDSFAMWHFDRGDTEGWTASGATLNGANGSLTVTATTADPYIVTPLMALPGALFTVIRLKLTRKAGSGWDGRFYTRTAAHSWGNYYKQVPNPNLAVGQSIILDVDMAALTVGGTDWTDNTILQVRFDFGSTTSDVFDVDWVGIGRIAPDRATLPLSGGRMIGAIDEAPTATVALSNGVLDAAAAQANAILATGSGTLNSFGTALEGVHRKVLFAGVMTLQNTSIQLPNGLPTLVTEFGDSCEILGMPNNTWKLLYYTRYSGRPLRPANLVSVSQLAGPYSSSDTAQVKIGTLTCTITAGNNPIEVSYSVVLQHIGSNNAGVMIKRNGVQLPQATWIIPATDNAFNYKQGTFIDNPGAGTWNYEFFYNTETTSDRLTTVTNSDTRFTRFIVAREIFA